MGQPDFKWTPPTDAVPVDTKSTWKPPSDAIPVVPKKAGGAGSPLTSPVSQSGSPSLLGGQNFSQVSPLSGTNAPVIQQARQQADQQVNSDIQAHQGQSDRYAKQLQAYEQHLTPDEYKSYQQMLSTPREQDNLREPSQAELAHRDFMDSNLGKVVGGLQYLGSKASKGALQIAKGGAWAFNNANNPAGAVVGLDPTKPTFDKLDQLSNLGLTKTDQANIENGKGLGYGALRTGGMLAEFAPAIAGGEVSNAPKTAFLLQGFGQGKETMDAVDPKNELNPLVRNGFIAGTGLVNAALMGDIGENVFGKMPAGVRGKVVSAIAADALKEAAGKDLTEAGYKELLNNGAKDFADKFQKFGTDYLTKVARTGVDLSALNTANFALKKGVDLDKPVFNETPSTLAEQISDVALKQAPLFGAIGSVSDLTKLTPYSNFKNDIVEHVSNSPEDAQNVKDQIVNHGVQNGWTPDEIKATNEHITQITDAAKKVPPQVPQAKRADAVQLVLDKGKLEKQLGEEQGKRLELDPAYHDAPTPQEQYLTDKIEQANDKLRSMATGKKTTYSKGVAEDEGKFFKTTDGVKEEIEPSRYGLESLERDAKTEPQATEINKEEPTNATQQEQVPQSSGTEHQDRNRSGETPQTSDSNSPVGATEGAKPQTEVPEPSKEQEAVKTLPNADKSEESTQNTPQKSVSRNNSAIDADREKRGLPKLFSEQEKTGGETWKQAMDEVDKNPNVADDIINRFKAKPFAPTDVENAILLHRRLTLENETDRLNQKVVEAHEKGEDPHAYDQQLQETSDKLQDLDKIDRESGTMSGRSLQSRQLAAKNDFSLARLELRKRAANGGRPLTEDERAEIRKVHADYEEKSKAYEAKIAELEKRNRDLIERDALNRLKKEAKREGKATTRAKRQQNKQDLIQDIKRKLAEQRVKASKLSSDIPFRQQFAELAAIAPELAKLAKSYIADGIDKLDDIVDKIHDDLKDAFEGLSKRDVRDALSGYGKEPQKETKGELQKKLEELRTQAKLQSKLEDLEAKEYKTPERKKPQVRAEIDALRKQIKELQQPETSLKSLKTRTANQIKEYERRIKEQDFEPTPKRPPVQLDPEAIKAKGDLDRVKSEYELELEKDKLKNRTATQKVLDKLQRYRRGILLTSIPTIGKIGTAALYRVLGTPLHELTGSLIKHIPGISKIASKSPREGAGFKIGAEKTALSSIWDKNTWEEANRKLHGKLDNLDLVYGGKKEHAETGHWLWNIFGNIHGAVKEFAKYNEFNRSVKLRSDFAEKQGLNLDDPNVQLNIGMAAFKDANRAIFMSDNLANKGYRMLTNFLESPSLEKDFGKSGANAAAVMKFLLPIVKVPTNYLLEKTQYIPAIGAARAAFTLLRKGIKDLPKEDADYVMRVFKKQGIGSGLMALGYAYPEAFGGLYTPGNKDDKYGLKANDVKLFGVSVPHFLTHTPMLSIMQLGATIRRATDSQKISSGLVTSGLAEAQDVAESTPFYTAPKEAAKVFEGEKQASAYAGDLLRSLIVPPDVKNIAEHYDTDENGNPIKRKPETVLQGVEEGIPGLRKNVPIQNPHPGFDKVSVGDKQYKLNNDQIQERQKYYDAFMKSEVAKRMQVTIASTKNDVEKKKLQTKLKTFASKASKRAILSKYHNAETGDYDLEKVDE